MIATPLNVRAAPAPVQPFGAGAEPCPLGAAAAHVHVPTGAALDDAAFDALLAGELCGVWNI
jgi:hypothetical protein